MATSFPALAIQTQGESPLNELARIEQIKGAQQQQQLQGQQLQSGALALQQQRTNVQSQQTLMQLFAKNNGDYNQTYADAKASGLVTPNDLFGFQTNAVDLQTKAAKLKTDELTNAAKEQSMMSNGLEEFKAIPAQQRTPDALARIVGNMATQGVDVSKFQTSLQQLAQNPTDDAIKLAETGLMGREWVINNEMKERGLAGAPTVEQMQTKTAAELAKTVADSKLAQLNLASAPTPEEAHSQRQAELNKTRAQAAEAFAGAQQKKAETMLIGQEPVFAYDPKTGQRAMLPRAQAAQQGYTNPVKVSESDVHAEVENTRIFNDVQTNTSRYTNDWKAGGTTGRSDRQETAMERIISDKDIVSSYIPLPQLMDEVKQGRYADDWSQLTPQQQKATADYIRTRSSVIAWQKGLTGMGRVSKEAMDLELKNIPTPLEDPQIAAPAMAAWQANIDAASQGNVRIPGMPDHNEIRQTIEGTPAATMIRNPLENR